MPDWSASRDSPIRRWPTKLSGTREEIGKRRPQNKNFITSNTNININTSTLGLNMVRPMLRRKGLLTT